MENQVTNNSKDAEEKTSAAQFDVELMIRVAEGDQRAFSDLYDRYSSALYSFIFKILNDAREAEDVLQEGFVQIWKKASSYNADRGSVFSWAALIMRSRAIDRFRSRARYQRDIETITEAATHQPGYDSGTERDLLFNEHRVRLRTALDRIPTEQREAIELAFFSGLTHLEISEKLQEPLGTVKARIRRGLAKLQSFLHRRA